MESRAAEVMLAWAKDGRLFTADARALIADLKINASAVDADLASVGPTPTRPSSAVPWTRSVRRSRS